MFSLKLNDWLIWWGLIVVFLSALFAEVDYGHWKTSKIELFEKNSQPPKAANYFHKISKSLAESWIHFWINQK